MERILEPEVMDDAAEVAAYAEADFSSTNRSFVDRVATSFGRRFDALKNVRILDIGCGPGEITIALAQAFPRVTLVGLDASEPMLVIARSRAQTAGVTNVEFLHGDAKQLDRPTPLYHAVVSNSLLHHLPDPTCFWTSIVNVVVPGAPLFIRDLRRPAGAEEARVIVELHAGFADPLLKEEFSRSLLAAFTADEVRAQAAAAGLSALDVHDFQDRYIEVDGVVA